jgi:hypothetical protein
MPNNSTLVISTSTQVPGGEIELMKARTEKARMTEVKEGLPHPCGATWDGEGTNFAIFSGNADFVLIWELFWPESPTDLIIRADS